ncbi:transcriptional regulator RcsA [Rahnella aquatilis]|jgi:LuxR family transcriptional regulator, capsular biosynthesis positive transcription factor|uniref:Transcriptional regulatory protein RcsA n=1 Tax=Rahnella sp. (strain Y9602) TaxID=2703885 RepID=A0A0H3FGX9_RAHSY|nr:MULTISPECIES: transcriptional regulator RcsA [Rahnella]AFE60088.1 colanic acid capsular biosynthesis activation protein A [Rahnella aquatilis HX2]AZP43841.1 transcriptional regulator RcsA [Rahnella aquatilis]ADW75398.1 regulatory protein LuxR [Rahnella aceris]AZP48178.1 transcriptional regulator RcsA [Rahnella aquatilis]MBU9849386.1 transcriptional regulator RcsA [Rahnella aceris]
MSSLIVDKCYYTQLALHSLLQLNGQHPKDILSLKDIDELQATCNSLTPEIIFVNEDCFTSDAQSGHVLREVIDAHPGTLFFVFISKENLNYQNYVPIRKNIIILSKSIRTATIYQLIAHNLLLARSAETEQPLDLTPVSLSRTESSILKMWMSGLNTQNISQHLNIKQKTVASHKGNIKRKVKTQNKQAIYHVVKLTDILTSGMFVGRTQPLRPDRETDEFTIPFG